MQVGGLLDEGHGTGEGDVLLLGRGQQTRSMPRLLVLSTAGEVVRIVTCDRGSGRQGSMLLLLLIRRRR